MNFRDATEEDLPLIVDIYNSTVASRMVTADTEPVTVESKRSWFHQHNNDTRPLWIVEEREDIIGWVSFNSFYGRPAYNATVELSIYLDPAHRGKGLGKEVLEYCLKNSGRLGITTVLGYIFAHNEPSLRLFYHFGFEDWGVLPDIALLDGKPATLKILGKRI